MRSAWRECSDPEGRVVTSRTDVSGWGRLTHKLAQSLQPGGSFQPKHAQQCAPGQLRQHRPQRGEVGRQLRRVGRRHQLGVAAAWCLLSLSVAERIVCRANGSRWQQRMRPSSLSLALLLKSWLQQCMQSWRIPCRCLATLHARRQSV